MNGQFNYSNHKQYEGYSITTTNSSWNKKDAELNFNTYVRQVEDSTKIISSTTEPLIFFYRFDFAVKRYIDLCNMSRYVKSKRNFIKETADLINSKQQYIQGLIIRIYRKESQKVLSLKTEKGKMNHIKKVRDSFLPFTDEMINENIIFLNSVIEKLKSGSNLEDMPVPPVINKLPAEQTESSVKNKYKPVFITILVFLFLSFSGTMCNHSKSSENSFSSISESSEVSETETKKTTAVTTEEITTTTKKVTSTIKTTTQKATTELIKNTNTELLESPKLKMLEIKDHPKLFESAKSAKSTWNQYIGEESVMIKDKTTHHYKYEDAVLVLDCYKSNGSSRNTDSDIRGIHIRFYNFSKSKNISNYNYNNDVSFERGLTIAQGYFPDDVISSHYTLHESFYQISENGSKNYSAVYKLNDGEDSEEFSHWVSVVLNVNETGNMSSLDLLCERVGDSRFESEKFDWDYDFLS